MELNTLFLIAAVVALILVKYIKFKKNRERYEKLINEIPGPRTYPLIGNMDIFMGTPRDVLRKSIKIFENGSPCRVWMLHRPFVFIFDPENFQIVANKVLHKNFGYNFVKDLMGDGLITSTGEKWRRNRRILNPAFNPNLLLKYFWNTFKDVNGKLVKLMDEECERGEKFNLWPYIINLTLNSITANAMHYSPKECMEKGENPYGASILKVSGLVGKRIYKPWLHPQFFYNLFKRIKGYDKALEHIYSLPKTIIEKRRKEIEEEEKSGECNEFNDFEKGKRAKTFIDILLKDSKTKLQLNDEDLTHEIVTFVSAGSETTALTMCSTLLMLAIHEKHQEKVYQEIQEVLGDTEELEIDHMNQLPYLEQCIKESMRRFPPVPILFRDTIEDLELKDGKIVPAGTTIALLVGTIHHDPQEYINPLEWNPDNFTPEAIARRHPCSFVPFSFGPRSCIGAKYAILTLKFALVTLLRRYKFHSDFKMKDVKVTFDIMLRSSRGYPIYIKKR